MSLDALVHALVHVLVYALVDSPRHQQQKNYNNVPGFSDLFVIQRKFRDKRKFVSQLRASTT